NQAAAIKLRAEPLSPKYLAHTAIGLGTGEFRFLPVDRQHQHGNDIPAHRLSGSGAHPEDDMRPARRRELVLNERPDLAAEKAASPDVTPGETLRRDPFEDAGLRG